ncbi:MAG: TolC family outer membrane protein [Alphaproteobacteria bacterium]|nr:TolC family outer membrane protein [Alphaproteobacteria bacterium]
MSYFLQRSGASRAVLLALMLGAPIAATGQTIEEALANAYRSNPQLLAERARLRAADEGVALALSNWRPNVSFSGDIGKARDWNRTVDTVTGRKTENERVRTPATASATVRQPLYRGGRTVAETSRAENTVQRGRAQLQVVEQQVLLDAATAYTNLLRDAAVLDLNVNNEQVLTRQLTATRDRFQVGEVTRTDVAQAEARVSRARADRIQAEGNLTSSRANYQRIVGEAPGKLQPARVPGHLPTSEAQALKMAADNPTLISAMFNERAAQDTIDVVAGELLPTVNLQGSLTRGEETQTRGFDRDTASVGVVVSVPLYQQGAVEARIREAKQTHGQRRIEVEDARRRAMEDTTRSWEALTTARARLQAINSQIRAAQVALDGVQQEARVGSRTVLDVLDAEQELLDAKVNLVRSQRDEIVAAFQLAAATGQLTAQKLALPVEVYDPTINYNETRGRWWGTSINADGEPKRK